MQGEVTLDATKSLCEWSCCFLGATAPVPSPISLNGHCKLEQGWLTNPRLDSMGNFHVLIASIKKTQGSTPSYELRLARRLEWKELVKCWQMRKPGAKLSKLPSD